MIQVCYIYYALYFYYYIVIHNEIITELTIMQTSRSPELVFLQLEGCLLYTSDAADDTCVV